MKKKNLLLNLCSIMVVLAASIGCFLYFQDIEDELEIRARNANELCLERLSALGKALEEYVALNNEKFPDTLEQLFKIGLLTDSDVLVCPSNHFHYIYIGDGLSGGAISPDTPIVFDRFHNHSNSINVLYADFHVGTVKVQPGGKYSSLFRLNKLTETERERLEKRLLLLDKTVFAR